jgi:hypothetical protein
MTVGSLLPEKSHGQSKKRLIVATSLLCSMCAPNGDGKPQRMIQ